MKRLIIATLVLMVGLTSCHKTRPADFDMLAIDRDIRKNLPIGSSRWQVEAYLDQKKVPHEYYGYGDVGSPENKNTEVALFRGPDPGSNLIRADAQVIFHFDPTGTKMIGFMVRGIYTGP